MNRDNRQLQEMVTALDAQIGTVRAHGLGHTAALLAMARLELQMKIHGITDAELRALTDAVAAGRKPTADIEVIDLASRRPRGRAKG